MNQKQIFDAIKVSHALSGSDFDLTRSKDHLIFTLKLGEIICQSKFRCQSYGSIYFLNPKGNSILNTDLNSAFEDLIIDRLKLRIDSDFTIIRASGHFKAGNNFDDFEIMTEDDLVTIISFINPYLDEVKDTFFNPARKIEYLGELIKENNFENQNKILVGGKFPVHIMKKIFILKKGGQNKRYREYKTGLERLFKLYEEKNPDKKEDVNVFWEGYNYFIDKLEATVTPLIS